MSAAHDPIPLASLWDTVLLDAKPDEPLRGISKHRTGDGGVADYFRGERTGKHYLRVWYADTDTFGWLEVLERSPTPATGPTTRETERP